MKNLINNFSFDQIKVTKNTAYGFLGGAIVFLLLLDVLIIMQPQLRALGSLNKKISQFSQNLSETKYNLERMSLYRKEAANLEEQLGKVENSILSRAEIATILEKVSRLADQLDIQINQLTPLRESQVLVLDSDEGEYFALPIFVEAEAGYHSIGRFFNKIETDKTFMSIQDFEISKSGQHPRKQVLKMPITVFIMRKSE